MCSSDLLARKTVSGTAMRTLCLVMVALAMSLLIAEVNTSTSRGASFRAVRDVPRITDNDRLLQEFAEMKTKINHLESVVDKISHELQHVTRENAELKSEVNAMKKATVATSKIMKPQLEEQLVNALEVRSIEDDVQQNKADISDLRVADKNFDVLLLQAFSMINNINATMHGEMDNIDQRLTMVEERTAVCGYLESTFFSHSTTLNFDRIYDEVDSTGEGSLAYNGYFSAGVAGIYFVTLETTVGLDDGEDLFGELVTSSGSYSNDKHFIYSNNHAHGGGALRDQASASRYVKLDEGETLHIQLEPRYVGEVGVFQTTMCVSLYSSVAEEDPTVQDWRL